MIPIDLKDKVAIVTGGGFGIGKGICEVLSEAGAAVVIAEVNEETGRQTEAELVKNTAGENSSPRTSLPPTTSGRWRKRLLICTEKSTSWSTMPESIS